MNSESEKTSLERTPPVNHARTSAITAPAKKMPAIRHTSPIVSFFPGKRRFRFSLRRLIMPLAALFLAWGMLSVYVESRLRPEICELARAQSEKYLLETVNDAVAKMAEAGEVRYDNMVKTIRDEKGEVIYLEVDTAMLAGAKAKLVRRIDEALEKKKRITLSVPLGSVSGWNLFSGIGFPVRIKLFSIGMTEGEIDTVLEDCGINQTRHLIRIRIRARLLAVLPGENAEVETEVTLPLGERVLVGEVPEIYLDTLGVG
ncbi:MAG: sporulation protein YunB [Clostridia bacterium]|nr:sporulation protein YunB [Clostridia bacterium]